MVCLVGLQFGCAPSGAARAGTASRLVTATTEPSSETRPPASVRATTVPNAPGTTASDVETENSPLVPVAEGWHELPLEGLEPALVYYVPRAPKLVVTHGAGGHAEWHCEHYRRLFAGRVTLLCARGKKRYFNDPAQGYYYSDHRALSTEVLRMVETFETRFEPRATGERYVYTGYSQGATMGALAFAAEGTVFSHLLLVEGGYADFSRALARRFQATGGVGVLFVCGTKTCHDRAQAATRELEALGVRAVLEWARGAGHRPDGPVTDALMRGLPKLFATEVRWNGLTPRRPDDSLNGNG